MKQAIIVIDMLVDFITGALECERAQQIVPKTVKLVENARKHNIPVIFTNDAHFENDSEMALWGKHALAGSDGAKVIPELNASESDTTIGKHFYSAFFGTELNNILKAKGVDTVVLCGIHAHICVQHTACDAFYNGYKVVLASDAITAFTENDYNNAFDTMKAFYGADIKTVDEIVKTM